MFDTFLVILNGMQVSTAELNPNRVSIIGSYQAKVVGGKVIQEPMRTLEQVSHV